MMLIYVVTFEELRDTCSEGLKWIRQNECFVEGFFDDPYRRARDRKTQLLAVPNRYRNVQMFAGNLYGLFGGFSS